MGLCVTLRLHNFLTGRFNIIEMHMEFNSKLPILIPPLSMAQLKSLQMFVTGADVIHVESITIEFTKVDLQRRPIAHTCSCVLKLPSTYDSYTEFV